MSIKGFVINGQTQKYDYPSLDNLPSFSLGIDGTDGLAYIYVNGVKQGTGIDVGGGGGSTRYNVTQTLSHASSSNSATKITEGNTYTTTLTADQNYEIKTVTITMGNIPVYGAYDESTGAISIANVSGDIVISNTAEILPIDLLNVTWANHAITCGQDTNNYNAWSPHNLQYDDVNECFVFLQCHCDRHMSQTYTNWTLSLINPYDTTDYTNITIPSFNGLGMLFVEDGVWTLMPRNQSFAYQSSDMGETWTTLQANIPQYLFGVYKCGDTYFGGDDKNSGLKYHKSSDLLTWTDETFDSNLGYTTLCETTFCEFGGKWWAFNRTNDDELGHPVILQSTDQGTTWTLFSDQMLHGYRSTVSCCPFRNYIIVADIDRDGGILYYSKFDGTTFTQLNTWTVPYGAMDFHNVNIATNYDDTIVLEFMHACPFSNYSYQRYKDGYTCDNVMLVGSTKTLPTLTIGNYIDTASAMVQYANANLTSGANGGTYTWTYPGYGDIYLTGSGSTTTFVDEIELPLNMIQLSNTTQAQLAFLADSDDLVYPWNNNTTGPLISQRTDRVCSYIGFVTVNNVRYCYGFLREGELPILIRVPYLINCTFSPASDQNNIQGESWQESLSFRRFIPVNFQNNGNTVKPWPAAAFTNVSGGDYSHAFGFMSYSLPSSS